MFRYRQIVRQCFQNWVARTQGSYEPVLGVPWLDDISTAFSVKKYKTTDYNHYWQRPVIIKLIVELYYSRNTAVKYK